MYKLSADFTQDLARISTGILIAFTSFLAPITSAFIVAIVLVILDTITKVMVVGKLKGIKEIKSKKLSQIIPKTIFYFVFIVLAQICTVYIDGTIPFVKLVLVAIVGIETYSIDENFEDLTGYSFIKKLIGFVKKLTQFKKEL